MPSVQRVSKLKYSAAHSALQLKGLRGWADKKSHRSNLAAHRKAWSNFNSHFCSQCLRSSAPGPIKNTRTFLFTRRMVTTAKTYLMVKLQSATIFNGAYFQGLTNVFTTLNSKHPSCWYPRKDRQSFPKLYCTLHILHVLIFKRWASTDPNTNLLIPPRMSWKHSTNMEMVFLPQSSSGRSGLILIGGT